MANPLDDHNNLLQVIREEWNTTEKFIKQAEQVCNNIVFPSINELRYAGRRLVDALNAISSGKDYSEVKTFLDDARFNCLRARHDAIDSSLSKMAVDVELMIDKLKYESIIPIYNEFPTFVRLLTHARTKIADSRQDRENRDKIYSSIQETDFDALLNHYKAIMGSESMMIAHAKQGRRMHLIHYSGLVVAVFAFAFAIYDHYSK